VEPVVILNRQEQEYLLRAIESGLGVASSRAFFLWTQGQVQALLPHEVMVCLAFGPGGGLARLECLHGTVLDAHVQRLLTDAGNGVVAASVPAIGSPPAWSDRNAVVMAGTGGACAPAGFDAANTIGDSASEVPLASRIAWPSFVIVNFMGFKILAVVG